MKFLHISTLILLTLFMCYIVFEAVVPIVTQAQTLVKYKNYYYVGGKVPIAQCKFIDERGCGAHLYGCTSGREYLCMNDIWTKE